MHSKAVVLSGSKTWNIAMPTQRRHLGKIAPNFPSVLVEKAQLHPAGDAGEQREVHAGTIERGAKRIGFPG